MHVREDHWAHPKGLLKGHNGGFQERLLPPVAGKQPHILAILWDDFGWASASWHRDYVLGGEHIPASSEVQTPALEALLRQGLELDRAYAFRECSPTRSAIQSGRHPTNVNVMNAAMETVNPGDPVAGFAGIPRNMTGIATKLAAAGYVTAYFGKWDAGMATPDHPPDGRGYQQGLWYYHHDNDYWSMTGGPQCNGQPITDLWHKRAGMDRGMPALGFNSTCVGRFPPGVHPEQCKPGPHHRMLHNIWKGYEDALFEHHVINLLDNHDPSRPLFIFWAPHAVHGPLQVPDAFLDRFANLEVADAPQGERQTYAAMVAMADESVGNVTRKLQEKGMWDDLVIVFMSDNGGPISEHGMTGGNNYPLKGGKYSNWEGGIRINSFVSGGFLHPSRRGRRYRGLVAAWDWYATFASLAGVDATDFRAQASGLPPVDSIDMSELLVGGRSLSACRLRRDFPIGAQPRPTALESATPCEDIAPWINSIDNCSSVVGIIAEREGRLWKLITGLEKQYVATGPYTPNSTAFLSTAPEYDRDCGAGCLFDLESDPLESTDLAELRPQMVNSLQRRMEEHARRSFNPRRGFNTGQACDAALNEYGGFWGPFVHP